MEQRTFLIVDSKATSIFYTASLLRKLRYIVRTAPSGEDALELIARSAPTCVITETALPKMSGLDLLEGSRAMRACGSSPSSSALPMEARRCVTPA